MAASSDSPSGASPTQQQHEAGAGASGAPEVDLAQVCVLPVHYRNNDTELLEVPVLHRFFYKPWVLRVFMCLLHLLVYRCSL